MTVEGLSGPSATYGVSVQLAVGEIAGSVRRESSDSPKNGRDGPIPADPGEGKCIVAIQLGVVHARIGLALNSRS